MKKRLITLLLTLTAAFCSCNNNQQNKDVADLLSSFSISMADEAACCVVIPNLSCAGCVQRTWLFLNDNHIDRRQKLIILDAYRNGKDPFAKNLNCQIVMVSCHVIDNAAILFANPTVIKLKKGKVQSVVSLQANRIDEMLHEQFDVVSVNGAGSGMKSSE